MKKLSLEKDMVPCPWLGSKMLARQHDEYEAKGASGSPLGIAFVAEKGHIPCARPYDAARGHAHAAARPDTERWSRLDIAATAPIFLSRPRLPTLGTALRMCLSRSQALRGNADLF
jgi:hypothetical protein